MRTVLHIVMVQERNMNSGSKNYKDTKGEYAFSKILPFFISCYLNLSLALFLNDSLYKRMFFMVYILKEDNVVCEFASFQTCWNHLEKGVMMADLNHFN